MSGVIVYALLAILLTVMIVKAFPVECAVSKREGFEDTKKENLSCPSGARSFIAENGDLQCCKGTVNGRKCEGSIVCSFSASATSDIPFCGNIPRFAPAVEKLLGPPERNVKVTEEEVTQGNTLFLNVLSYIYVVLVEVLVQASVPQDQLDELNKFYGDEKAWKTAYAAKVDNTVLAKEAKYALEQFRSTKLAKATGTQKLDEFYPLLVKNDKQAMEQLKSYTQLVEKMATDKKIALP